MKYLDDLITELESYCTHTPPVVEDEDVTLDNTTVTVDNTNITADTE